MTFQQLLYFQSVADSLSFSKAAKECFVSQTAISRQIRQLEQEMDLRLFDRDTTHVTLTSAGRYFFQQAQQITAQLRQAGEKKVQAISNIPIFSPLRFCARGRLAWSTSL